MGITAEGAEVDHDRPVLVLAVDDDVLILDLIQTTLTDAGYSVVTATEGDEALELLEGMASEIDGLVTDVNLGDAAATGWRVARRARELIPNIPVVYVSGDSEADWPVHGVPESILLSKPLASSEVVVALASARSRP
ncbi:MAG: response regulator [Pseudomonadota bacterium]